MDVREKLVELLSDLYGCDPAYYDVDAWAIAQHLVDRAVAFQKWISVDDRLPEEKVNCIVHYKHAYCDNDNYFETGICFYDGEKFRIDCAYKVTHWMPMPQPPKGE